MQKLADISSFESLSTRGSISIYNRVDKYGRIIRDQDAPANTGYTNDMSMGYPTTTFDEINAEYAVKRGQQRQPRTPISQVRGNTQVPPQAPTQVPTQVPQQQQARSEINPYSKQARQQCLQSAIGLLADTIGEFQGTGLSKEQVLQIINKMVNERF